MAKQVLERNRERFYRVLHDCGLRLTKPRRALVDCLLDRQDWEFQARDLHRELDAASPGMISRATVYRTLDLLVEAGVVEKQQVGDNLWQFQLSAEGLQACHYHLIDPETGRMASFVANAELRAALRKVCAEHGFKEQYHVLEVFGKFGRKGRKPAGRSAVRPVVNGSAPTTPDHGVQGSEPAKLKRSGMTAEAASE